MSPQRQAFLVPVHRTLSSLGAVTGLGVFWVVELKRDLHAPFQSMQQVLIIQVNSETRHQIQTIKGYYGVETMKTKCFIVAQLALFVLIISASAGVENRNMQIRSPSFENLRSIPKKHTCDAEDLSPPIEWSGAPNGTKSFALIVDDPDAPDPANPKMTWVHWVIYNIPTAIRALPEGVQEKDLPEGTLQGLNDWKRTGYGGPCPPIGAHRYFHKLYALDVVLPDLKQPTKAKLEKAMEGHILSKTELIGVYQRD
jgi:Raf kinase inhibitor-like YbhB/YbcL family protein